MYVKLQIKEFEIYLCKFTEISESDIFNKLKIYKEYRLT